MKDVKVAAGFYLCLSLLGLCWSLITKNGWSLGHIFGLPAIFAVFFYIFKRKDLFD
jgi:hypothetical protein